ncbi:MAG: hypothetical protein NC041_03155 [Bacteroides sp.]|nr:hypothetical protein [Prevotella sp.]MCM1408392.1 hypothetical protein [Treponema brennaborense]MCM1469446.1 hypothetical protein [Bacteroides sp.]
MTVEKIGTADGTLYTYSEAVKNLEKILLAEEESYYNERKKDDADFAANYPTFEDYKKHLAAEEGYDSFDEYLAEYKEDATGNLKAIFGAATTFGYKTNGGSMTLTEKFTGIENMGRGRCTYRENNVYIYIYNASQVSYENSSAYYYGTANTEKKDNSLHA